MHRKELLKKILVNRFICRTDSWFHRATLASLIHLGIILCLFVRNWQTTRFMEVEVAIRLLYMLAEALPVSHGAHFSGDVTKATALQDMMRTVSI